MATGSNLFVLTTTTSTFVEVPLRHLRNSRWPVSNFNQPAKPALYQQLLMNYAQSQRTRLNTTKPKRLTRTGMQAASHSSPAINKSLRTTIKSRYQQLGQTPMYTITNEALDVQDQEAKDPSIPLPQRHRPKVSKKPQTRSPRHDEGVEGGQGGEEGYCINWDLCLLVKAKTCW